MALSIFLLLSLSLHAALFFVDRIEMMQPSIVPLEEREPIYIDLVMTEVPEPEPEPVVEPIEPEVDIVIEEKVEPQPDPEPEVELEPPPEVVEDVVAEPDREEQELIEVAEVIAEDVITEPAIIRNPPPPYPQEARRRGWEGVVLLRVHITHEGRVSRIEVSNSSGYTLLDDTALRTAQRWRFVPARQRGHAVATSIELPVRFQLRPQRDSL